MFVRLVYRLRLSAKDQRIFLQEDAWRYEVLMHVRFLEVIIYVKKKNQKFFLTDYLWNTCMFTSTSCKLVISENFGFSTAHTGIPLVKNEKFGQTFQFCLNGQWTNNQ